MTQSTVYLVVEDQWDDRIIHAAYFDEQAANADAAARNAALLPQHNMSPSDKPFGVESFPILDSDPPSM